VSYDLVHGARGQLILVDAVVKQIAGGIIGEAVEAVVVGGRAGTIAGERGLHGMRPVPLPAVA
jgi:hypothetical protein